MIVLETWTWSPIENREYRMKEVSSIVIAQNTLYLLNASLQEEWCDWLALNLSKTYRSYVVISFP